MGTALTIFFLFLFYGLAQYFFPVYQEDYRGGKSMEELKKQYGKADLWSILFLFTIVPIFTVLLGYVFYELAQLRNTQLFLGAESVYSLELGAWFVLGLAWAFYLIFPFSHWLGKKVFKINLAELYQYYDLRYGFDNRKIGKWLGTLLLALALLLTPFFYNTYTAFYSERIEVNQFFEFQASTYHYQDIEALLKVNFFQAPNGDIKNNPKYLIIWADGKEWDPNWNGLPDLADQAVLFEYLSQKTGKRIIEVEMIDDYLPE